MNKAATYTSPLIASHQKQKSQQKSKLKPPQETQNKQPMFIIRIDVGENKYEDLKYYEGDNTEKLANKFALKFNLDPEAVSLVAAQLKAKVEQETQKKKQQQELLKEKVKQDIQQELKQYKSARRSKSRLQTQRCSSTNNQLSSSTTRNESNQSMVTQQPAYDRLYNIAVTKNQKLKQQQQLQDSTNIQSSNNGKILNSSQKCKTSRQSFCNNITKNNESENNQSQTKNQDSQSKLNQTSAASQNHNSYVSNNVHYSGGFGDRMYLQHTRKRELIDISPMEDQQNKQILDYIVQHPQKPLPKQSFVASHSSSMICADRFINRTEELLLDWGKKYSDRKAKLIEEREEEIKMECKFQPQLDEKRLQKYLKQTNSRSVKDIHSFLFEEDKLRNQKIKEEQDKLEEQLKKQANRGVSIDKDNAVQAVEEITNRLTNLNQRKKWFEEKSLERQKFETKVDAETGQQLFKPKLNISARKENNEHNKFVIKQNKENKLRINEILYLESKIIKEKKEQLRQSYHNKSKDEVKLSNKSQKIVENRQRNSLQELFWALDSDNDGLISSDKIDLGQLSNKALDILTTFLVSMEEKKQELDFEKFLLEINPFIQTLSIVDRDELLGPKQKIQELTQRHSFKPQISERSQKLANKRSASRGEFTEYITRPLSSKRSHYTTTTIGNDDQQSVYSEFENLQSRDSKEMKDCTFKPYISKKSEKLSKIAKERENSGCSSSRQDALHKNFQPLIERKNQELLSVMKKTINLRVDQ